MIGFYATQLHLLARWTGGPWGVVRRGIATLVISMLALVVTAWLLPSVGLRDVPSAVAAALVLAAMRTFLRPVLIAYVSQISVAVATIATVLVQALAFWLIAGAGWMVLDRPVDAVVGSVLFSIGNALLTAVLSTGDDRSFFGTLVRQLAARHRKSDVSKATLIVSASERKKTPVTPVSSASGRKTTTGVTSPHASGRVGAAWAQQTGWEPGPADA